MAAKFTAMLPASRGYSADSNSNSNSDAPRRRRRRRPQAASPHPPAPPQHQLVAPPAGMRALSSPPHGGLTTRS